MYQRFLIQILTVFLFLTFSNAIAQNDSTSYDLKIGGALRFNYIYKTWDENNKSKNGEFAYDMIRIEAKANYNNLITSAQIRFYNSDFGGILIHHAYAGYIINDYSRVLIGIHQNPFGIQTYASNNWFFNIGYYVGLEDDYDLGIKYQLEKEQWNWQVAFYKNSELPPNNFSRYSYDITGTQNEINQFNTKFEYLVKKSKLGLSWQWGQLEEVATSNKGNHQAFAMHAVIPIHNFELKLQGSYYKINPRGNEKDIVFMSAYGAEYEVSTEANILTAGIKYYLAIDHRILQSLDFYNDFGWINKSLEGHNDSMMNVFGIGVNMYKMYSYIDYAMGKNHAWLGPEWSSAFSTGLENTEWHARFNINMGYYF